MEDVKVHNYKNLQQAWEGTNEYLLLAEKEILKRGGGRYGPEIVSYNNIIRAETAAIDKNFNFGYVLGYKSKKWTSLINNYVDFNYLDLIKSEVLIREKKKSRSYNLAFHFSNSHTSGKDCLISLNISRRLNIDKPVLVFHTRNTECTKRLIFDFLLVQRICEYIFGHTDAIVEFYAPTIFISAEHFTMYNNHRDIKKLLKPYKFDLGGFQQRVLDVLQKYLTCDPWAITYKSHRRAALQIQMGEDGLPKSKAPDMFAHQLQLIHRDGIAYPEDCITHKARKSFKRRSKVNG